MTHNIDIELAISRLGLKLDHPPKPAANYVPYVVSNDHLYVSGQVSIGQDGLIAGKVGHELSAEQGQEAARVAAVNIISRVHQACKGDWGRFVRCVRVQGFVNCTHSFIEIPLVIDGASTLFVDVFGERGRHSRSAVGAHSLPRGAAVELDAVFQIHSGS